MPTLTDRSILACYHVSRGMKKSQAAREYGIRHGTIERMTYDSIHRECRELAKLSAGATIKTAWDYTIPWVKRIASKKNLFPSHIVTVFDED